MKLKQVVLIGGPDDGVIDPWQSRYSCKQQEELTFSIEIGEYSVEWVLQVKRRSLSLPGLPGIIIVVVYIRWRVGTP